MNQDTLRTLSRIAKTLQSIGDELATTAPGPTVQDARMRRAGHRLRRIATDLDSLIDEEIARYGTE